MSVVAISFDYFPTYFIIALRLIKGKNSLYMVKIILHFKRAFMKILCFVKRILIHVISLVKQFLHPFFFFSFVLIYDHKTKLFRELRYDMLRFTHCGRFRAKYCLYSGH